MPTSIPPLSVRKNEINEVSLTVASIFLKKTLANTRKYYVRTFADNDYFRYKNIIAQNCMDNEKKSIVSF